MSFRAWPIIIPIFVAGCVCTHSAQELKEDSTALEMYSRGDGLDAIRCTYMPVPDVCASQSWLGFAFRDCSDENFECIFDGFNVMAVPKQPLSPRQTYSMFGSAFVVERCFGDEGNCDIAMIASECADSKTCGCRRADIGQTRMKFYFSEARGVTAFYVEAAGDSAERARHGLDDAEMADAIPLRMYVLAADMGFLRASLNLKAARMSTGCAQ